mmetsp:Transcript_32383/g.38691  ORF Transcript_32383/g.38691 Transcript_32383/m.38691 type:complete len:410 (-) Transcript_32383:76-1305(-)
MDSSYNNRRWSNTSRNSSNFRDYSIRRILLISTVITILFVTNPANDVQLMPASVRSSFYTCTSRTSKRKRRKKRGNSNGTGFDSWNAFGMWIDNSIFCPITECYDSFINGNEKKMGRYMETNYGIFAMWIERNTGVHLGFLSQDYTICQFQSDTYGTSYNSSYYGSTCNWVATNLCHGMKAFDGSNAFTALRIIQILKILSYLLSTCYRYSSNLFYTIRQRNPFAPFLSLFRQDYWYKDLISINLFVYPALVLLERISAIGTSRHISAKLHFWVGTFGLVVIFGGLANMMTPMLTRQRQDNIYGSRHGMKGSVAACLGYIVAVAPNKIVLDLDWLIEIGLTAGDVLFGSLGIAFLCHITGLHLHSLGISKEWSAGDNVLWVIGGFFGLFFGKWQLDKYVKLWWNPFGIF